MRFILIDKFFLFVFLKSLININIKYIYLKHKIELIIIHNIYSIAIINIKPRFFLIFSI